jgi:hypothetical protein
VARSASIPGLLTSKFHDWWAAIHWTPAKWLPSGAPADTVQRHEFLRILLEWAAGEGPLGGRPELEEITSRIRAALASNGVASPGDTLQNVRFHLLAQERAFPNAPAHMWNTAAFIDVCPSDFVGKVNSWFDAMGARTSQRFGLQSKFITGAVALAVALFLPLDSVDLIRRLTTDDNYRNKLVQQAEKVVDDIEKRQAATLQEQQAKQIDKAAAQAKAQETLKEQMAAIDIPPGPLTGKPFPSLRSFDGWRQLFGAYCPYWSQHFPGLLLSWVLLSLGAPFWYDALKNALRFRSLVAQKEEKDRKDRATPDAATPAGASTAGAAIAAGTVSVAALPVLAEDESGNMDDVVAVG